MIFAKSKKKTLVIGLDGVPLSLLKNLCSNGITPQMAELFSNGLLQEMTVSLPEISAVSWPTFMTGVDSGTHGIFGFTDLTPETYKLTFPGYNQIKAPAIWDKLGEKGKRSVVINQPGTYPARPIKGALVSGFVAIELVKSIYPPRYIGPLKRMDYQVDIDTQRARKDHDYCLKELSRTLKVRREAFDLFWKEEDWDYFEIVLTGTDRLQHYLFHAVADESHKLHQRCMNYYQEVDNFVGYAVNKHLKENGKEAPWFLLSDHGFCLLEQEVSLNRFLMQKGFLHFEHDAPSSLEPIMENSVAFALDPSRIYLHYKNKYSKGRLSKNDGAKVKAEIIAALTELKYEGRQVVKRVFDRDEIYYGSLAENGPDLVVLSHHGFDLKAAPDRTELFSISDLSGMHTFDDAVFFSSQGEHLNPSKIANVAPLILKTLE